MGRKQRLKQSLLKGLGVGKEKIPISKVAKVAAKAGKAAGTTATAAAAAAESTKVAEKGFMGMGLKEMGAGLIATLLVKELIGTMGDLGIMGQSRGEKEAALINQQAAGTSAEDYYLQAALPQQAQSADAVRDMLMQALGQGAGVQPRRQTATGEELIGGM